MDCLCGPVAPGSRTSIAVRGRGAGEGSRAGPGQAEGPGLVVGALGLDHSHRLVAITRDVGNILDILGRRGAVVRGAQVARAIVTVDEDGHRHRIVEGAVARKQGRHLAEQPVSLDRTGAVVLQVLRFIIK